MRTVDVATLTQNIKERSFCFFPERDHKKDGFLFLSSGKVLEKKVLFFSDKTLKKSFCFFE